MPDVKEEITKTGFKTSEFIGKTVVQVLTLIAMFLPDANIDPTTGIAIVAALEGIYTLFRSIYKAFAARFLAPPEVIVQKV